MYAMEKRDPALMIMSEGTFLVAKFYARMVDHELVSNDSEPAYYEVSLEINVSMMANIVQLRCPASTMRNLKRRKLHTFRLRHHPEGVVFDAISINREFGWRELYT